MRLLEKTTTRNIFDMLEESYDCESYEQAAKEACEELFDAMTDDIFLNSVDVTEENNTIKVTFNVSAYGGDPDENGDIELNRDATIEVPLDYTDNGENMTINEFYESFSELLKQWILDHNDGPSSFYEGVNITSGTTVVNSSESGLTVIDNGNTITTGNGAVVNINDESEILPADTEETIEEPTEEVEVSSEETEEPSEETEVSDEEIDEPIESEETEDVVEESTVTEEVLEEPTEETEEEINNSKSDECDKEIEECDQKLEEVDGVLSQNVEIFQNPEFDYSIKDITELDNIDTGDVRAIDMQNILIGLDEALTERFGTENWGTLNSFITRKGKHKKTNESYSSAILELSLPNNYNKVLMLEVYGDKLLKECVVRDSRSKIITRLCGKSANPVNHFESVILDIINNKRLNEDIEYLVQEPEREENINFADSNDINIDKEAQEKRLKDKEKLNDEEFKVEKEPDQENTAGEKIADSTDTVEMEDPEKPKKEKVDAEKVEAKEIKEAEEIIDEEPLESEISDEDTEMEEGVTSTAIFHKTPSTTSQMKKQEDAGITTNQSEYTIYETVELSDEEFNEFKDNLQGDYDFLQSTDTSTSDSYKCIEIKNKDTGEALLVDTNGTGKARYVAFEDVAIENVETPEEEKEAIEDTDEDISNAEAIENIMSEE